MIRSFCNGERHGQRPTFGQVREIPGRGFVPQLAQGLLFEIRTKNWSPGGEPALRRSGTALEWSNGPGNDHPAACECARTSFAQSRHCS